MERQASDGGFKSNISLGGVGRAYKPPKEMAALAVKVAHELKLDVAGVDILFDESGYRVCEANSAPGFQGLERACDIDVPETVFVAMGKKFGLPIRHSDRWQAAIDKAASAAFGGRRRASAAQAPDPLVSPPLVPRHARIKKTPT
jgi:gamma-F420-2:alpha-L-glutamate ligase